MNSERANSRNLSGRDCPLHCILDETFAYSFSLVRSLDRQASQDHQRNWVMCHSLQEPLRRIFVSDFTNYECVITNDNILSNCDVCLGCICQLTL